MGRRTITRIWIAFFIAHLISLSGCIKNGETEKNDQIAPDHTADSVTEKKIDEEPSNQTAESHNMHLDEPLQHLVMTDCRGAFSRIDEPAPLFPFHGPEGWESVLPLDDYMQTEGYNCKSSIINDKFTFLNTTIIVETHDNLAPPSDHPFQGTYNSVKSILSIHADPPEFAAWLEKIFPETKAGALVKLERTTGDRKETAFMQTSLGEYQVNVALEDRLEETASDEGGPHRMIVKYDYPYLWMEQTDSTCSDALILAEYSTATGDMAATQMQPFPGSPLPSRSVIHLCSSFEWTLGGSEL